MPQPGCATSQPPAICRAGSRRSADLDQPVAADSSARRRCCGRIAYLTGPNSVECTPPRNSAASSSGEAVQEEADRADTMIAISSATMMRDEARLLVLVGELAGGGREQQERQDEQRLREVLQRVGRHRGERRRLVREQDHERLLEDVVVDGAEELAPKNGAKRRSRSRRNWLRSDNRASPSHAPHIPTHPPKCSWYFAPFENRQAPVPRLGPLSAYSQFT